MADDARDARPPTPSMRALLAAGDAARALSTPPPAPQDGGDADDASAPAGTDDRTRRGDRRDAA